MKTAARSASLNPSSPRPASLSLTEESDVGSASEKTDVRCYRCPSRDRSHRTRRPYVRQLRDSANVASDESGRSLAPPLLPSRDRCEPKTVRLDPAREQRLPARRLVARLPGRRARATAVRARTLAESAALK